MMGDLLRKVAIPIAKQYGFEYPMQEDRKVTTFLKHIRSLPRDAMEIYPAWTSEVADLTNKSSIQTE